MGIRFQEPVDPHIDMAISDLHTPVLLQRCIELLAPALTGPGAVLLDATLGMGGHAEAFLDRFPSLTVVGMDRDTEALTLAEERLARFGARVKTIHTVFHRIDDVRERFGIEHLDGALFDLGVSSLQLDRVERGFSYSKDAPLDMRMDSSSERTAASILAEYPEAELRRIFFEYGEEKLAGRYAHRIVQARDQQPLQRSGELVEVIAKATPAALARVGHPAKRVFQALRIEVNSELSALERALPPAIDLLRVGGRIVVLSYQSLEDRIVKRFLQARSSSTAPAGLPVELPEHRPELRLLVRGAERADDEETMRNARSTAVRLRAAERVRGDS